MKFLRHHTQHSAKYLHVIIFFTVLLDSQSSLAIESRKIEKLIEDTQPPDKKAVLLQERQKILKEGRKYYFKFCVHCHGNKGAGDGTASYHLFPQPRELSQGIYKFHIAKNKEFDKGQLFSFTFKNNEVQMYWDDQPENSLHETGTLIAEGPINRVLELDNGIKIWTGTTYDNFQGNAVGAEAFKHKVLEKKEYDLSTFDVGEKGNFFGKGNAAVIVFEIPNEFLSEDIFYYASTSLEEEPGHWHQVNHIANVLFPHFYMGYEDKLRSKYGSQGAVVDEEIKQNVIENLSNYVNAAGIQKDTDAYLKQLMDSSESGFSIIDRLMEKFPKLTYEDGKELIEEQEEMYKVGESIANEVDNSMDLGLLSGDTVVDTGLNTDTGGRIKRIKKGSDKVSRSNRL